MVRTNHSTVEPENDLDWPVQFTYRWATAGTWGPEVRWRRLPGHGPPPMPEQPMGTVDCVTEQRGPGGSAPDPSVRTRVLDAFVELVSERGLASTSMRDVAERAGVSKTTLYTRWPDRRSMIADGFAHGVADGQPDGFAYGIAHGQSNGQPHASAHATAHEHHPQQQHRRQWFRRPLQLQFRRPLRQ